VAASLIVLSRLGRITEADARAVIAAGGDGPRARIERLWDRFASAYLQPQS
jgi:hypothetical protein